MWVVFTHILNNVHQTKNLLNYFNSLKYHGKSKQIDNTHIPKHKFGKETPFPIYLSLRIHSHTRKKVGLLIDTL